MYNCLCHSVHCSKILRRVKIWFMHPCHFQKPACSCLRHRSIALEIRLMMSLVEAVLSWDFSIFEGSDSCHDFFFLFTSASIFLVVVCSEIRWNTVPILLPALLPWRVAFPVYLQLVCQCHRSADELGDLVHLSLFSLVGGLFCLSCQVFHVGLPVYPCHRLHSSHPSLSSSHGVVCSPGRLSADHKMHPCSFRGFIKGQALGKLTGCERDIAINLPGCFCLLFLLPFIRKTKNAWLKNPTDLLHKNLMKPLLAY